MRRTPIVTLLLLVVLTVVFVFGTGVDGAAAATVTRYQQNAAQLTYIGTWSVGSATAASGGSYRYANASGMAVTATFNGTSLAWISKMGPTYGIAKVQVDGGATVPVDLYSPTVLYQQKVWETGTLTAGYHTVRIELDRHQEPRGHQHQHRRGRLRRRGDAGCGDARRADRPAPGLARQLGQGLSDLVLRRHRLVRELGRIVREHRVRRPHHHPARQEGAHVRLRGRESRRGRAGHGGSLQLVHRLQAGHLDERSAQRRPPCGHTLLDGRETRSGHQHQRRPGRLRPASAP